MNQDLTDESISPRAHSWDAILLFQCRLRSLSIHFLRVWSRMKPNLLLIFIYLFLLEMQRGDAINISKRYHHFQRKWCFLIFQLKSFRNFQSKPTSVVRMGVGSHYGCSGARTPILTTNIIEGCFHTIRFCLISIFWFIIFPCSFLS